MVRLTDPLTKRHRHIGNFASEEDAARAYDCAAVQAHGPSAKRNFPGEPISVPPATVGEERKQRSGSHYLGVSWNKASSSWRVQMTVQGKRKHIGYYASEEDAARAYDRAAVQLGSDAKKKLNFPGEDMQEAPGMDISEPPVSSGGGCSKVSAKRRRQAPPQSESESESVSESDQQSESEEEEQSEQQSVEEQSESEEEEEQSEQQSEEQQSESEEEQQSAGEQIRQLLMAASEKASIVAAMKQ
jgi:Mg-chelatase subunit ChlI